MAKEWLSTSPESHCQEPLVAVVTSLEKDGAHIVVTTPEGNDYVRILAREEFVKAGFHVGESLNLTTIVMVQDGRVVTMTELARPAEGQIREEPVNGRVGVSQGVLERV